jgi:D-inositol-3-phosphate glycosyltransferase
MISLHTSPLAPLGRTRDAGGMNVYVRQLSRELSRGGVQVDVFTRWVDPADPPIEPLGERARLIRIQAGPLTPLPTSALLPHSAEFADRIRHFARRTGGGYDLVHSHYWLSGVAGQTLADSWDVPHVTMFHTLELLKSERLGGPSPLTPEGARRAEYEALIARSADVVTAATAHERDRLRRLYDLPASRVRVLPCGVDLRTFAPAGAAKRAAARAGLDLGREPVLLSVGRLDPIKGVDLVLASLAQMRTPATLVLVGGDPSGDPELERLRTRAEELGVADRLRLPGAAPQDDLPRYYHAADALVVASRYESFGLVAVEALACGTPVVAANVGGLPSIVRDGENGVLVAPRTAEAFAAALDALLADMPRLERLRAAARPSVERFDWRRLGAQIRQLYQELADEPRPMRACSCF